MISVLINAAAVVAGGLAGTFMRGAIGEKYRETINHGLALCVMVIGISGAIATENVLLMILSLAAGSVCGECLRIESHIDRAARFAETKLANGDDGFAKGFFGATLLFCVGSMAVVGAIEAGITGHSDTLMAKSALDGITSVILASALGPGVILSAAPLLVYQGGIALAATAAGSFLPADAVREMSAVGSVLILGIGINMLGVLQKPIRVGNMLPAILVPAVYLSVFTLF